MIFKDIAHPLIKRGICVVPTYPGERNSFFKDWQNLATTDATKIDEWNAANADYNCISVAKQGGIWILDTDNYPACVAMGMPDIGADDVFLVKSPREQGYHFYFKHDELTAALPNRLNIYDGDNLIAEAKFHNHTCCSPGPSRSPIARRLNTTEKENALPGYSQ